MSLTDCNFRIHYNTDENDLCKEFYCQALVQANLYRRAVGFFSSSSLILISKGIEELLKKGGRMELLVSPRLSLEDIEAIKNGYENRENIIYDSLIRNFKINEQTSIEQYNYLAWLIFEEKLEIKVVVRKDFSDFGIFHDKFGIIYDEFNNKVAFHGSQNESETAYLDNYESIDIFLSWDSRDFYRVLYNEQSFESIWNNKCNKWETIHFPEALKNEILKLRSEERPISYAPNDNNIANFKTVQIPKSLELRGYQKDAIKAWLINNGKGIFEMATGTGKTITSIAAMVKLLEQYNKKSIPCGILVIVPYKALLEQWDEALLRFNINATKCYELKSLWFERLSNQISLFNKGILSNLFFITTNTTFKSNEFQELLTKIKNDYILCIDEMHHFATEKGIQELPNNAKCKLGLSATLMTKYDNVNMNNLINYFDNGIVYKFSLERAIQEGFLTPYYYYPIFVDLTDNEKDDYFEISQQISRLAYSFHEDTENPILQNLLIKRSRIIASAENKLNKLREMKDKIIKTNLNLFYCGDKKESDVRYIEKVNRLLAYEFNLKTHTFTAEEDKTTRLSLIREFACGNIQALTAIRCLDEGIDIPELRRAFILSSGTNPKEFIQRRGRILRRSPGKEFAEVYDFIVVPTLNKEYLKSMSYEEIKIEQQIILREFERFKEFAKLAKNKNDAFSRILEVWGLYDNLN